MCRIERDHVGRPPRGRRPGSTGDDPADRRSKRAELTPISGRKRRRTARRVVAEVEAAFAESLGPTERLALAKVLSSLK